MIILILLSLLIITLSIYVIVNINNINNRLNKLNSGTDSNVTSFLTTTISSDNSTLLSTSGGNEIKLSLADGNKPTLTAYVNGQPVPLNIDKGLYVTGGDLTVQKNLNVSGKTTLYGLGNNGMIETNQLNINNNNGTVTHFNYNGESKNYIRGLSEISGNTSVIGSISSSGEIKTSSIFRSSGDIQGCGAILSGGVVCDTGESSRENIINALSNIKTKYNEHVHGYDSFTRNTLKTTNTI